MKTIAMYLPQYHSIPENDRRIYPGYTEWDLVKKAEPLFENHYQPRIPLGYNYYNLSDWRVLDSQAELALQYGIDGFCFYHYYFNHNKIVMNNPLLLLLERRSIQIEFCLCWANESWGEKGNIWTNRFQSHETIIQEYGDEKEWEAHYNYLNRFFADERYIKINNKPVFVIYKPEDIKMFSQMSQKCNHLAVKDGFDGIYFIGINTWNKLDGMDAVLFHAPNCGFCRGNNDELKNGVLLKDYNAVWERILSIEMDNRKAYYGSFVDFDNTSRYGNNHSLCMKNAGLDAFTYYFEKAVQKNIKANNELIWINAWNEWSEGNYLEPDEKNRYRYLEAIRNIYKKLT